MRTSFKYYSIRRRLYSWGGNYCHADIQISLRTMRTNNSYSTKGHLGNAEWSIAGGKLIIYSHQGITSTSADDMKNLIIQLFYSGTPLFQSATWYREPLVPVGGRQHNSNPKPTNPRWGQTISAWRVIRTRTFVCLIQFILNTCSNVQVQVHQMRWNSLCSVKRSKMQLDAVRTRT